MASGEEALKEEGRPLSTHSWGGGAAAMFFFFTKEKAPLFLPGLSIMISWYATASTDLFLDILWNVPGVNATLMVGFDYFFEKRRIPWYFGFGIGPHFLEKAGVTLQDRTGISCMGCLGRTFDLNRQLQLRLQAPIRLAVGAKTTFAAGFELSGVLFGPLRDVRALP
jgi:hypothetical protein